MPWHNTSFYDIVPHIAELYDKSETYTDDVSLIQYLIGKHSPLRILEPFCGTGRILIPLALAGHELVGLDQSPGMLARAHTKVDVLPDAVQERVSLVEADVLNSQWSQGFDLVILGANCFYELATPQRQEHCIVSAAAALKPGGYLYIDNNHMEGDLAESWQRPGVRESFPTGLCDDGTQLESTIETIWYDAPARLARFRRTTKVILPNEQVIENEYIQQKHPVSTGEVRTWLGAHGFEIEQLFGDREGNPYNGDADRAIFWARKSCSSL